MRILTLCVDDYRLFAEFKDERMIIFIFEVAHRREIYKSKQASPHCSPV